MVVDLKKQNVYPFQSEQISKKTGSLLQITLYRWRIRSRFLRLYDEVERLDPENADSPGDTDVPDFNPWTCRTILVINRAVNLRQYVAATNLPEKMQITKISRKDRIFDIAPVIVPAPCVHWFAEILRFPCG